MTGINRVMGRQTKGLRAEISGSCQLNCGKPKQAPEWASRGVTKGSMGLPMHSEAHLKIH
jgi:hypothetical protein